jgi:hypothetical protein
MSTLTRAFMSFSFAVCILSCKECKEYNYLGNCFRTHVYAYLLQVIPYLLRVIQAFNVVYFKKQYWPHMANGFRFLTSSITITMSFLYSNRYIDSMYYYISFAIATYCYNIFWDFYVSWKVLRPKAKYFLIRDRITYPQWFYYYAILSNLFLRASWTLRYIFVNTSPVTIYTCMMLLETWRRIQFILIRTENEALNNPEKYRKFMPVPEISEDTTANENIQDQERNNHKST